MRTFIGVILLLLGATSLLNGAGVFSLVLMAGGMLVLLAGRTVPDENAESRIPLPSERGGRSLIETLPQVVALPPARVANTGDTLDVAALRAAVETLSKRQNTLEQSRKLQKATARIQRLEREVAGLRRRLERLDPTPDMQTALDASAPSTVLTTEPPRAAVDALARLLDRT